MRMSNLASWLQSHGFVQDPFGHYTADNIPFDVLQETYLYDLSFEDHLSNDRSVVLLAPYGGGKTFARQYTKFHREKSAAINTLVVIYKEFTAVAEALPNVRLHHHTAPLMRAVVEAVWQKLDHEPERYMQLYSPKQTWWLKMFSTYSSIGLEGLLGENIFLAEFILGSEAYKKLQIERSRQPFSKSISLALILKEVATQCKDLRLDKILVLVDEVDSQEQNSPDEMEEILSPLLNNLQIFSDRNVVWKYFLPNSLSIVVNRSSAVRGLRVEVAEIFWNFSQLKELLQTQLAWASVSTVSSLAQLSEEIPELDDEFITIVQQNQSRHGAPRTLLMYGRTLLATVANRGDDLITKAGWQAFLDLIHKQTPNHELEVATAREQLEPMTLSELRQVLIEHFNLDELRTLSLDLNIVYEDIPGDTLSAKARELVQYCDRHGRLDALKEKISEARPNLVESNEDAN